MSPLSFVPTLTPKSKVTWENWHPTLLSDEPQASKDQGSAHETTHGIRFEPILRHRKLPLAGIIWSNYQVLARDWHSVRRTTPRKGKERGVGLAEWRQFRQMESAPVLDGRKRIHLSWLWTKPCANVGAPGRTPRLWELTNTQGAKWHAQQLTVWRISLGKQESCSVLVWGTPGSTPGLTRGSGSPSSENSFL